MSKDLLKHKKTHCNEIIVIDLLEKVCYMGRRESHLKVKKITCIKNSCQLGFDPWKTLKRRNIRLNKYAVVSVENKAFYNKIGFLFQKLRLCCDPGHM